MGMAVCPTSGLVLPTEFIDMKQSLKSSINSVLDESVLSLSHMRENYFLTLHAKFDKFDGSTFTISQPVATFKLPPFTSNQMVWWVSNKRGICELLWMVSPRKKGTKLKVEFNDKGVAYLQAKGAMPS